MNEQSRREKRIRVPTSNLKYLNLVEAVLVFDFACTTKTKVKGLNFKLD